MIKKIILTGIVFCGYFEFSNMSYATNYLSENNSSILDSGVDKIDFDTIFNFVPELNTPNATIPKILTNLVENFDKIEYDAELVDYNKNSYNYLIIYNAEYNKEPKELFRIELKKTGVGSIKDKKLLNNIKPNMRLMAKVKSYKLKDNVLEENSSSKNSKYYYTSKKINFIIKEDEKTVFDKDITIKSSVIDDRVNVNISELGLYKTDKYYTYDNSEVLVDKNKYKLNKDTIDIPYESKEINIILDKQDTNWISVNIKHFKNEKNKIYKIKKGLTIKEFILENKLNYKEDNNSKFIGYFIEDKNIEEQLNTKLDKNTEITAKYTTEVQIKGEENKILYLNTGDKLSEIDKKYFSKKNYHIVGYKLVDNETKKEQDVESLDNLFVERSITIEPKYKENTNKIMIRQDDYNKRFGQVDDSIKNLDVEWKVTEKIGNLFEQLRKKIKPNEGYEVIFRINKKPINDNEFVDSESVLEIYYKKIEEDWINVKFVGEGIDKFLSDGQDVLVGNRLDRDINLPTATGQTDKEFLGWKASEDYIIEIDNKKIKRKKESLLTSNNLGAVVTSKGKELVFTAIYRENFKLSFEKTNIGEVVFSKNNFLSIKEGEVIKKSIGDIKIILLPRNNYKFSHFISKKDILIQDNNNEKIITSGNKITLENIENIIPNSNIELIPIFVFDNYVSDMTTLKIKGYYDIDEVLDNKNIEDSLIKILGPLYFLK